MNLNGRKILYVITKSNWGGAQRYVYDLAVASKAAGAEVAVATGGVGLLTEKLRAADIRVVTVAGLERDVHARSEASALSSLLTLMRGEHPDVVHLNSSKAGGLGALAARLAGVRTIIFTAHGWAHREPRNFLSRTLIWLASWLTVVLATRVIAVSGRDYHSAPVFFSRRKIITIHNGIRPDAPLSPRDDAWALLEERTQAPLAEPLLISIGELTRNKAHEILLEALAGLEISATAVIIGEGEKRRDLEAYIARYNLERSVSLTGFIPDAERFLSAADIFVLPSRKEGLPYVLLEAGHAGLAVVASDTGGIKEIIEHDVSGLLVPPGDAAALKRALEKLINDPAKRMQYGIALKERVRTEFALETMLAKTLALYVP